ncbi:MAG: hypothetical protein HQM16_04010, partial [Deltaproteobacteria bacterium]|nr:hypothetical protein [Deltaproteobacteria bacterium]
MMRREKYEKRGEQTGGRDDTAGRGHTGKIKAFGSREGDGGIRLQFVLPVAKNETGVIAARIFCEQMGLKKITVAHMESLGRGLTSFLIGAQSESEVDVSKIVEPLYEHPTYSFDEVNTLIKNRIKRKVVV